MKYLRPTEILEEHPELKKIWTAQQIGYLLALKLVDGYKTRDSSLINPDDVLKISKLIK